MTTEERYKKIEELEGQIHTLKEEVIKNNQKDILPFIKEKAVCHYSGGMALHLTFEDPKDYVALVKMIEPNSWGSSRCELTKTANISTHDSNCSIFFNISGSVSGLRKDIIEECKAMGLKVSVEYEQKKLITDIARAQKKLTELEEFAKLIV